MGRSLLSLAILIRIIVDQEMFPRELYAVVIVQWLLQTRNVIMEVEYLHVQKNVKYIL